MRTPKYILAYEMVNKGIPRAEVANRLHISQKTLRDYLWKARHRDVWLKINRRRCRLRYKRKVGRSYIKTQNKLGYKYWSDEEIEFLREKYNQMSAKEIARKLDRSPASIYGKIMKIGLRKYPRPWQPIPSKELGYVLGVIFGDGSVTSKKVSLGVKDEEFAKAFFESLKKIGLNPKIKPYRGGWVVWACNKDFCEWVNKLSLSQIISFVVKNGLIAPFIKGFYDSDGSLQVTSKKYGRIVFYNSDRDLLISIKHLLSSFGINSVLYLRHKAGRVSLRNDNAKIISRKDQFRLGIYRQEDVKKFLDQIGSSIPRKGCLRWVG